MWLENKKKQPPSTEIAEDKFSFVAEWRGMYTRTKIICTLGPSCDSYETIVELIKSGMNVARLNFSHGTYEEHQARIERLKRARKTLGVPLAIMLDTKGPEIRVGKIKGGAIALSPGQELRLVGDPVEGNLDRIPVTPGHILTRLTKGVRVLFDDGYILSTVVREVPTGVIVKIENGGILRSLKGINVPDIDAALPVMTEKDIEDLRFGCKEGIDLIAASFIRSPDHVLEIKRFLAKHGGVDILVMAKIENWQGVLHFDTILQVADGIMVARGDLGVELPLTQVPKLQKMMIRKCRIAGKPVIIATQMLESMIKNPRPTRAEVSDVAGAIYDSATSIMLSGETAVGQFPIEATRMMYSIVQETEQDFPYREFFFNHGRNDYNDVAHSIALASVRTAYSAGAKSIFVFTNSGKTARHVSQFRPEMPIVALSPNARVYHQLALNWGVRAVPPQPASNAQEAFRLASEYALHNDLVQRGDLVVATAGIPFGVSGTTNMTFVESIGNVLVRGNPHPGKPLQAEVLIVRSPEEKGMGALRGKIAVISRCNATYLPLAKVIQGIVLENSPEDLESEEFALQMARERELPILTRADGAMEKLKDGMHVLLDPEKGVIYTQEN